MHNHRHRPNGFMFWTMRSDFPFSDKTWKPAPESTRTPHIVSTTIRLDPNLHPTDQIEHPALICSARYQKMNIDVKTDSPTSSQVEVEVATRDYKR